MLRITTELSEAESAEVIFSEMYEGDLGDIFAFRIVLPLAS